LASSLAHKWSFSDSLLQKLRHRKVLKLIPEKCVVADLGCGSGNFLRAIKKKITFGYGIDFIIKYGPSYDNCSFIEADLNREIPLEDGSVDVVTALAVLEHLTEPNVFAKEILRILKFRGKCILTTPAPRAKGVLELLAFKFKLISEEDIRDHKHYFSRKELEKLFAGFTHLRISSFQFGFNTIIVVGK
jgi:ubiquinone/menaquinone biosynthesis C-methylase UbiE